MIPDLSVIWVIVFVLILSVVLDRLLFRPLLRVMNERARAIQAARELADVSAASAQAALLEVDAKRFEARGELYRQMDEMRREAAARRGDVIERTRAEAEAAMREATARIRAQAEEANARLEREADDLAGAIAARVLGRRIS